MLPSIQASSGFTAQRLDRAAHREERGAQDVDAVDLLDARRGDRPGDGALLDPAGEHLAPLGGQHLGIGQAR